MAAENGEFMAATIISGKALAEQIRTKIKEEIAAFQAKNGFLPGLAVVLVGDDPASHTYVAGKERACKEVGMYSEVKRLPVQTTQAELDAVVDEYNARNDIHGLLVQFPLPGHLNEKEIIARIRPEKDVDGLSNQNAGALFAGQRGLISCTPKGVIEMIKSTGQSIEGKSAVVVGRSNLVGKPVAILLMNENATVTICHSRTRNLKEVCRSADILVAATGRPGMIQGDFVKEGAIVIDVGTTRVDGKLKGDVEFDAACERAAYISPVPGGVGPMTITMLLENTMEAAEESIKR